VPDVIVFVHGVPETAGLWREIRHHLDRGTVALSLPGFAVPRPSNFGATKDDYAGWLISQIEALGGPVDLVGHDWGALITYRVQQTRPDLLRSWVADVPNGIHPDVVWHDFAKIWQTPGEGEKFWEDQQNVPLADRIALFEAFGVSAAYAAEMAAAADAVMASCILDLYRSATPNIHATWGPFGRSARPGLVILPDGDPFSAGHLGPEVVRTLGAASVELKDAGHWWATQHPAEAARIIGEFVDAV
jgi:pimeloyl-ACP methyl ester carboxylesterase